MPLDRTRPAPRGIATVLALATLGLGLGLLVLALDDGATTAVTLEDGWATWLVGAVGAIYTLLGFRALVRLFGGRWAERSRQPPTTGDRRRLRVVGLLDLAVGAALVLLGIADGAGEAIRLDGWAIPAAIAMGVFRLLLGLGLLLTTVARARQAGAATSP